MKNKNKPSNGKHTVVLFRCIYLIPVKELFKTKEIQLNLLMVSIYLPAHKELFTREFDLLQVHLNLCQSVQFSTRTGFCWPPSKLCNIWFLLPVWLTEDLFGCLFATPMLCHHYIIRDLRGSSYPRCVNLNLLFLFFHSFIHFHRQWPAASWLLLPPASVSFQVCAPWRPNLTLLWWRSTVRRIL